MRLALAVLLALSAGAAQACAVDPFGQSAYGGSLAVDTATQGLVARAWFDGPSTAYDHFVLGRETEPTELHVQYTPAGSLCGTVIGAGADHVFEDLAPRLADLDGDGTNEVIVVRSHRRKGAQLAVYGAQGAGFGLVAQTGYIGQEHRWLAPAGIADFDGDGRIEIAYVDRPHLLAELVIVRMRGDRLVEVSRLPSLTNHRIGDNFISGGVRECGAGVELVLASKDWSRMMRVRDGRAEDIGPMPRKGLRAMPRC